MSVARYWHTLRHLRPVQFYGRLWFRLARPRPDLRPAPPRRALAGGWVLPARREASLAGAERFRLLNEVHDLADCGWDGPGPEKLWRYNQHYFDDLNAQDADARQDWHRALLSRWARDNPPARGVGWEPYPTSLRIVNWVKWALAGHTLPPEYLESLAVQSRWLARRLEIHLLGNHLFANAKALVFAGLFFQGPEAQAWLERGMGILAREVPEQILPDGGHFERSTLYHALALEDMLDLCNLAAVFAPALPPRWRAEIEGWRGRVVAMRAWLLAMCHPDGDISLFNDAALGIAPTPAELLRYAEALGFAPALPVAAGATHLADSGYVRLALGPAVALLDVAPVGPDYLPGHAHADTLSFELSAFGQRVLVNAGTSCYGLGPERQRQRGTAAHNTVLVDGQDSSEVWAGFRVARRARPVGLALEAGPDSLAVRCGHDGYRRLPGQPEHWREWRLEAGSLLVEDRVSGAFGDAQARFHLHPAVAAEVLEPGAAGRLRLADGHCLDWRAERGTVSVEASTYHPRFGVAEPSQCLVLRLQDAESRIRFTWD